MPVSHTKIFSTISSWPLPFAEISQLNGRCMHLQRLSKICNIVLSFYFIYGSTMAFSRICHTSILECRSYPQEYSSNTVAKVFHPTFYQADRNLSRDASTSSGSILSFTPGYHCWSHNEWIYKVMGAIAKKRKSLVLPPARFKLGEGMSPPIFASYFYQNVFFVHQQKYRRTIYILSRVALDQFYLWDADEFSKLIDSATQHLLVIRFIMHFDSFIRAASNHYLQSSVFGASG